MKLNVPTAIVLVAMLAGSVAIYALVDAADRASALLAYTAFAGTLLAFMRGVVARPPRPAPVASASTSTPRPPTREEMHAARDRDRADREARRGAAAIDTLVATFLLFVAGLSLWLAFAWMAFAVSGCGASAVRTHATAATVIAVATTGAARAVEAGAVADAEASCPTAEAACMAHLRDAWAPADVAIASARAALMAYVEALSIAQAAGDGADLWAPLATALGRVLVAWDQLAAILREHEIDVPPLPESVLALARAIGGA